MRGCGVPRRYIDVCYCDMFSAVKVYLDHLKFCVCSTVLTESMSSGELGKRRDARRRVVSCRSRHRRLD